MKKYWLIKDGKNLLIAIAENTIYVGSVEKYDESKLLRDLDAGIIPDNIFNILFSRIRSVENSQGKNIIVIHYGDDLSEELIINDIEIKKEIFSQLRISLSKFDYIEKTPSKFEHARPQILAIIILTGLYLWVLYFANELSKGYEYTVVGGRHGLNSLILGIAHFGFLKVTIGYVSLIFVVSYSLGKRLESRTVTEYLRRRKN